MNKSATPHLPLEQSLPNQIIRTEWLAFGHDAVEIVNQLLANPLKMSEIKYLAAELRFQINRHSTVVNNRILAALEVLEEEIEKKNSS